MVGSYQTITYNRYAVQSATKFKAKIVDIPFCDPESGFAILIASRIEDGKSIVLKGIIPNPVENAYITYQGHWEQDARRGTQYVKVESSEIDYEAGGTDSIYELLTSGYVPGGRTRNGKENHQSIWCRFPQNNREKPGKADGTGRNQRKGSKENPRCLYSYRKRPGIDFFSTSLHLNAENQCRSERVRGQQAGISRHQGESVLPISRCQWHRVCCI